MSHWNGPLRDGVTVSGLSFGYAGGAPLFTNMSFSVRPAETVGIMGPSGCGKSTLLRLLAGLIPTEPGIVHVDGEAPERSARSGAVSFAFQQPALLPWRSCLDNMLLPLHLLKRDTPRELTQELLHSFGLRGSETKLPHQLSGGLAQRTSLARALVVEPALLLLDEPLSFVDWPLRRSMLLLLRTFCRSRHVTAVVVSHDARELVFLCDRVVVFSAGVSTSLREFALPSLGNTTIDTFGSPTFFKTTVDLDDFAYPAAP